jgi:hypothetical protein
MKQVKCESEREKQKSKRLDEGQRIYRELIITKQYL